MNAYIFLGTPITVKTNPSTSIWWVGLEVTGGSEPIGLV